MSGLIKMRDEARRGGWVGRGPRVRGNGAGLVDGSLREHRRIAALEQGLEASVGEVSAKVNVLEREAREPPSCHPGCSEAAQRAAQVRLTWSWVRPQTHPWSSLQSLRVQLGRYTQCRMNPRRWGRWSGGPRNSLSAAKAVDKPCPVLGGLEKGHPQRRAGSEGWRPSRPRSFNSEPCEDLTDGGRGG